MRKLVQLLGLVTVILLVVFALGINEAFGQGFADIMGDPVAGGHIQRFNAPPAIDGQCYIDGWGLMTCVS